MPSTRCRHRITSSAINSPKTYPRARTVLHHRRCSCMYRWGTAYSRRTRRVFGLVHSPIERPHTARPRCCRFVSRTHVILLKSQWWRNYLNRENVFRAKYAHKNTHNRIFQNRICPSPARHAAGAAKRYQTRSGPERFSGRAAARGTLGARSTSRSRARRFARTVRTAVARGSSRKSSRGRGNVTCRRMTSPCL